MLFRSADGGAALGRGCSRRCRAFLGSWRRWADAARPGEVDGDGEVVSVVFGQRRGEDECGGGSGEVRSTTMRSKHCRKRRTRDSGDAHEDGIEEERVRGIGEGLTVTEK